MADDGESGRGGGRSGGRGTVARKFMPTVPGRRKKAEDGAGGTSAAAAAATDEAFKDLIQQAAVEETWERGRGRGRGRGQQRFHVTFGGVDQRPTLPASRKSYSVARPGAPSSGGASTSGGGGGSRTGDGGGGGGGSHAGGKSGTGMEVDEGPLPDGKQYHKVKKRETFLDYTQHHPTILPMRHPGELDDDEYEDEEGPPVPKDLAITEPAVEDTARQLGLLAEEEQEQMLLLQLPTVLPAAMPTPAAAAAAAEAAARRGKPGAPAPPASCTLKDFESGKIGKLLVFKSGKVKMQLGDVLMDVSMGLPAKHRQEVAAINSAVSACVLLGAVGTRAVVSPDVYQLMTSDSLPHFERDEGEIERFNSLQVKSEGGGGDAKANGVNVKQEGVQH